MSYTLFESVFVWFISERELKFTFALLSRVRLSSVSVCRLSVTLVHPTQPVENFGNISTAFGTLKVRNAVEILPKISTDKLRQQKTDRRTTDGRTITYGEREH